MGNGHAVVIGFGLGQGGLQFDQTRIAGDDKGGGRFVGFGHVLCDLRHAPLRRNIEAATVFVQRAIEQRKQAGFSGAVAPDQTDVFSGVDGGVNAIEQHLGTAAQDDVFESNHENLKCMRDGARYAKRQKIENCPPEAKRCRRFKR